MVCTKLLSPLRCESIVGFSNDLSFLTLYFVHTLIPGVKDENTKIGIGGKGVAIFCSPNMLHHTIMNTLNCKLVGFEVRGIESTERVYMKTDG